LKKKDEIKTIIQTDKNEEKIEKSNIYHEEIRTNYIKPAQIGIVNYKPTPVENVKSTWDITTVIIGFFTVIILVYFLVLQSHLSYRVYVLEEALIHNNWIEELKESKEKITFMEKYLYAISNNLSKENKDFKIISEKMKHQTANEELQRKLNIWKVEIENIQKDILIDPDSIKLKLSSIDRDLQNYQKSLEAPSSYNLSYLIYIILFLLPIYFLFKKLWFPTNK